MGMTIEQKAKAYDIAVKKLTTLFGSGDTCTREEIEYVFPELAESEDEQIRKGLISIQWKGDNLKEVIDFTGVYKEGFEKWFHNSWEEYEKYVHEHGDIFKIFNEDGSHMEVPVGAWIIKAPDGYNTASRFGFIPKPAEWSEEDEIALQAIIGDYEMLKDGASSNTVKAIYDSRIKFVKSLRHQKQWEPSKEQIMALRWVLNNVPYNKYKEEISGLIEQIKDFV